MENDEIHMFRNSVLLSVVVLRKVLDLDNDVSIQLTK